MHFQYFNVDLPVVLEESIEICNELFSHFFWYAKYIFSIILILLGVSTLLRFRGIYRRQKISELGQKKEKPNLKEKLGKAYVVMGTAYIFLGFGIIFNFLTYILIWCLEPLPDQYLFNIIDYLELFETEEIIRIFDLNNTTNSFEELIFHIVALVSFVSNIQIASTVWFLLKDGIPIGNPVSTYLFLLTGIVEGILVGFTTCLPLFL